MWLPPWLSSVRIHLMRYSRRVNDVHLYLVWSDISYLALNVLEVPRVAMGTVQAGHQSSSSSSLGSSFEGFSDDQTLNHEITGEVVNLCLF